MDQTSIEVARRLREKRQEVGLTQEQVANRLQRRQATMSEWESGRTLPSIQDLYDIALVFGCDITELLPPQRLGPPPRGIMRAMQAELPPAPLLIEKLAEVVAAAATLEVPKAELSVKGDDPGRLATRLLSKADMTSPPVDVGVLANRCGISVLVSTAVPHAISGMLFELDQGPLIVVNANHPETRQRFTLAHEIGHLLLGHLETFHVDLSSATEAEMKPTYEPDQEKAANAFAANLLMPSPWIRDHVQEIDTTDALAKLFQVSEIAMGYRLSSLRVRPPDPTTS